MIIPSNFIEFVESHANEKPAELILRHSGKSLDFDLDFAAVQIKARQNARNKLSNFLMNKEFIFPDSLSAEQASDQRVAQFHAKLIGANKFVIDLTGGLGIDSMTIALAGNKVKAIELDSKKAEALSYNKALFAIENFEVINADSIEWISHSDENPDFFFIDPARRDSNLKRTYSFKDCLPDVSSFYKDLLNRGSDMLIKASPLLDISEIRKELDRILCIYIVSVRNEVKEVLIHLSSKSSEETEIFAIDLNDEGIIFEYKLDLYSYKKDLTVYAEEKDINPNVYLYEPSAAIMKLHAGNDLCMRYEGLKKVSQNTELFVSSIYFPNFPGRIILINEILTSKTIKSIKGKCYSVAVRNYPLDAQSLRKRLGVKESNDLFIYGMKVGKKEKPILIAGKKIERL